MYCRHFDRSEDDDDDPRLMCTAYPDGIPDPILENKADHRKPIDGDSGIQYENDPRFVLTDEGADELFV